MANVCSFFLRVISKNIEISLVCLMLKCCEYFFYQLAGVVVGIVIVTTWGSLSKKQLIFDPLLFLLDCHALLVLKLLLVVKSVRSFLKINRLVLYRWALELEKASNDHKEHLSSSQRYCALLSQCNFPLLKRLFVDYDW